jgi:TPR repeat protein
MYFRIAAKANHPKAQHQLSVLYPDSNPQESLLLLYKATQGGYSKATRHYDSIAQNPPAIFKQIFTEQVDPVMLSRFS